MEGKKIQYASIHAATYINLQPFQHMENSLKLQENAAKEWKTEKKIHRVKWGFFR